MKKEKFVKVMRATDGNGLSQYDTKGNVIMKTEIDESYKETVFGFEEDGTGYEYDVYYSKTTDTKYKWQATEGSTGLLICFGKTQATCADEVMHRLDRMHKVLSYINISANMANMLDKSKELVKNAKIQ